MKKITVTLGAKDREIAIPDTAAPRVENAIAHNYGYQARIPNPEPQPAEGEPGHEELEAEIDNPQAKDDFVKDTVKKFLEDNVKAYEADKAANDARQAVLDEDFTLN